MNIPTQAVTALLDLVYPRQCVSCGATLQSESGRLCWDCLSRIEVITPPFCRRCGDPADGHVEHEYLCSWCRQREMPFESARSAVRYRGPVRAAIRAFKYEHDSSLRLDLVSLAVACVRTQYAGVWFDAVAFVPLHARRERERTYNQSHLLARGVAAALGKPLLTRCLRRVRATATQTAMKAEDRRKNVKNAFAAVNPGWIEGRSLLLVDDVMTTGATVSECASVLMRAGAAGVRVVTVARGG